MKAKTLTFETVRDIGVQERNFPKFAIGDLIAVYQKLKEGDKERLQAFEGDVIAIRSKGNASTFTVRKIGANSVPVERIFPYYSPMIDSIEFVRKGKVRRAKLFYLRKRVGRAARVEEDKTSTKASRAVASSDVPVAE
ncbi:50S ribosomal protein L19 [Methylicorpusculum sp.]|uniref:50S ribosomal protein L19 n=1 Tax=Methylicorpusculum sp. TaxID=2713644 RepID=UPI003A101C53